VPSDFTFSFEGKPVAAKEGQSVAAALLAAGERCLRIDEAGNPKGAVCGIGACWECRCSIEGVPDTRACMTPARPGMIVRRQRGLDQWTDR
jgi:predicted molibdopterin-dependent oxidoreductase YjgC